MHLPVLPPTATADPARFGCSHCGHCCTDTIVPVTADDVLRLASVTGQRPGKLIAFHGAADIVGGGDHLAFAVLDTGPRVMALAQRHDERLGQRVCKLLRDKRCSAYAARPLVCRVFPFVIPPASPTAGDAPGVTLQRAVPCEDTQDGAVDLAEVARLGVEDAAQDRRWRERVDTWNAHAAGGTRAEFLTFVFGPGA